MVSKSCVFLMGLFLLMNLACRQGLDEKEPQKETEPSVSDLIKPYMGLTEKEAKDLAKKEGRDLRILQREDQSFDLTGNHVPSRINVKIKGGVVVGGKSG